MKDFTQNGRFPLATFSSLELRNVDEVYAQFTRLVRRHSLVDFDAQEAVSELHYAPLSRMALSNARLGTNMVVSASPVNDSCLILCALDKPFMMTIDGRDELVSEESPGMVMPGMAFILTAPADASSLMLEVDLDYLESLIASDLYIELDRPLRFLPNDSRRAVGQGFSDLLRFVRGELSDGHPQAYRQGYLCRLEEMIGCALIYTTRHNYSDRLAASEQEPAPRYLNRAVDYIHAHTSDALTLESIANVAATSKRSLIRGFQRYKGCRPMLYVRNVRLEEARERLLRAVPGEISVTEVALRCGFSNLGRFASWYREKYGEYPAQTLRCTFRPH